MSIRPEEFYFHMFLSERIVTQFPLTSLWTNNRTLQVVRERHLNEASMRELLKQTPVAFVIADVGSNLEWIDPNQCYQFWKEEVQKHVADNPDTIYPDNFPDGYAYIASE